MGADRRTGLSYHPLPLDTPLSIAERVASLPERHLWILLMVGGRFPFLDVLERALTVPLEKLAEHRSIPEEVRQAVVSGDAPVRRRFLLALFIRWQYLGEPQPMGIVMTNAVMGRCEHRFPQLLADLSLLLPEPQQAKKLVEPQAEQVQQRTCAASKRRQTKRKTLGIFRFLFS